MNSSSAQIFTFFLFIIAFVYLAWNNYDLPSFYIGDTSECEAEITDINLMADAVGRSKTRQLITYVYTVNDSTYTGRKSINKRYSRKKIGDTITIKYSINDPSNHNIEFLYKKTKLLLL